MPMHDWTRVDHGLYHDFHFGWTATLSGALNTGVLPASHYALTEYNAAPLDSTLAFDLPHTAFDGLEEEVFYLAKRRTIAVRRASDHRKVALVELLSPGVKASAAALAAFVQKACAAIRTGIHLLVVDPFPQTAHAPTGIHGAIWNAVRGGAFAHFEEKPLTLVSYCAAPDPSAYLDVFAVGDALPEMPLFLEAERYVSVPLEPTYTAALTGLPRHIRAELDAAG